MRIASSQIDMSSKRNYSQMGVRTGKNAQDQSGFTGALNRSYSLTQDYEKSSNYNKKGEYAGDEKVDEVKDTNSSASKNKSFTYDVLNELLDKLLNFSSQDLSSRGPVSRMVTYSESESMSFAAQGVAITEDGRQIDFGVSISMSRSFTQYMNVQIPMVQNALMDPLVINLDSGTANVSDQKFRFDLDADGNEEFISMPTRGTAFLALDLNGDGSINDGSELFGTKSGDGFGDLRAYDSDGNGWIDENDEIFDKLRVWYKDDRGQDVLADLRQADVGAIFLGEQQSEFSLGDGFGGTSGVIRSTGIFLKESGGVGTIQHVDLAVEDEKNRVPDKQPVEAYDEKVPGESGDAHGVLTIDLDSDNTPSVNKASRERANRRAQLEAKRAERAEKKKLMNDRMEKRRLERQKLEDKLIERTMERQKMFREAYGA